MAGRLTSKQRQRMAKTHKTRDLVATLRDALHQLADTLERTRDGVDALTSQATRLREGIAAPGALRQREDASVGIDMVIDAATDLFQAFRDLAMALPDAQADMETLAAETEDNEDGSDV
jgi:chromosome segregation ATPase